MKFNQSLKHSWTFIILITVIVPATSLTAWFGYQLYSSQLNSALLIEQQANEALRDQIESEFNRLKTVFHNKIDSLSPLVDQPANPQTLQEITRYLNFIIKRESAVREIIIVSKQRKVIAAIDPNIGISTNHSLSNEELQQLKAHWGFDDVNEPPEFAIPFFGRDYISSPEKHDGFMSFTLSVPIGSPVKAVLISTIDINYLWSHEQKTHTANPGLTRDYLIDRRGGLIASTNTKDQHKIGSLMTHLNIVRQALTNAPWQTSEPYFGISNHSVFGTLTRIPSLNWTLISEVITFEITRPIWRALAKVFIIIFIALSIFIWIVLNLAKKTINPIERACKATHQVSQGNFQVALKPCGIQELDILAFDFNLMVKARKHAEEQLQLSDRVFKETHDGITITDRYSIIVDVNPSFCEITGYNRDEVIGKNPSILSSGRQDPGFYKEMWETITQQDHWQGEIWNRHKNGDLYAELLTISTLRDDNNDLLYYVGIFSDITQSKKQQETLEQMAHYDVLTKLPNRVLLTDRFSQALAHCKRHETLLAVCFLDLDDFKPVNDRYGHETGDQLLVEVAQRIKNNIRDEDTVSRQGGDEFALLLGDIDSFSQCEQMLKRIIKSLSQAFKIDGHSISIGASIGITLFPIDDADFDTLLRHADQSMYQAKLAGRNRYHLFNTEQDQLTIQKTIHLKEVQQALSNNELCLFYQPKVNMRTGKVFGAEALIRWIHPEKGLIPPLDFLPIIEETELEIQIGNWVINEALTQQDTWKSQGTELEVSVNISSYHLQSPSFISDLDAAMRKHPQVHSKLLQLEILESSALGDLQSISSIIKSCIDILGVNIALDDFGTGYSSLTHLRNLPAQILKIDQSFVRDILDDPNDHAIIDGVIGLANSFNRKIIAEGVETTEHGLMLLNMGCSEAQGYGIAKPMPAENFPIWLDNYKPNQQWLDYANQTFSPKDQKVLLFQLALTQWHHLFKRNIQSSPGCTGQWPILKRTKCHCGIWIKRAKQEHLFEQSNLDKLDEEHTLMHNIADKLFDLFHKGEIDRARKELTKLETAINAINKALGLCK